MDDTRKKLVDALMGWQSIGYRDDGRTAIRSPDGQTMTEFQMTAPSPYGPGWVNFPSIYGGQPPLPEDEARATMIRNGWVDPDTGAGTYQQTFPDAETAALAAALRSRILKARTFGGK